MLPIMPLTASDIPECLQLSAEAGWNQTAKDWQRIVAPGQAFGLRNSARLIASGAVLPYGPHFGWICMILVTAQERRQGHAVRLMRHCLDLLGQQGLTAGLDATPTGRTLYVQLGFRDIYPVSRLEAPGAPPPFPDRSGVEIAPIASADLEHIRSWDRAAFGGERGDLLASLREERPELALRASVDGRLTGYAFGRNGRFAVQAGPIVAETPETACALLDRIRSLVSCPLVIDVPDHQAVFKNWLHSQGFTLQRSFTRMLRERSQPFDLPSQIRALTGPEFA